MDPPKSWNKREPRVIVGEDYAGNMSVMFERQDGSVRVAKLSCIQLLMTKDNISNRIKLLAEATRNDPNLTAEVARCIAVHEAKRSTFKIPTLNTPLYTNRVSKKTASYELSEERRKKPHWEIRVIRRLPIVPRYGRRLVALRRMFGVLVGQMGFRGRSRPSTAFTPYQIAARPAEKQCLGGAKHVITRPQN